MAKRDCEKLEEMVQKDSQFLRDHGLMDYSLLLVVEQLRGGTVREGRNLYLSRNGEQAIHIGIIDFLQDWSFSKRVEATYKKLKLKKD